MTWWNTENGMIMLKRLLQEYVMLSMDAKWMQ
jgi:hypothetical protein